MPLSRLLVSVALLFAASVLALPQGIAHAAGDRKQKMRKEAGRGGKEHQQMPRRERDGRAAPAHGLQHGRHGGGHVLAPNERQNLRQSVYDAMRDIYPGG